jgi:hypothetical protein
MISKSNLILILIIGLVILFIFLSSQTNINKEQFPEMPINYKQNKTGTCDPSEVVDDVLSWKSTVSSANVTKSNLNPNFLDIQFHNDYRDLITGFNNLVPDKRQRFNLANIPIIYSEPENGEVKHLVKDFIHVVNENLKTEVPSVTNKNSGWDEVVPDRNLYFETGFSKLQKNLGLPTSLWEDPAKSNPVDLVAIPLVQKYETEDEIKYSIDIVLQKRNVEDQVVIKASFVQDKRPLTDENNFFVTTKVDLKVVIEDIFIVGYLSKYGNNGKLQFDGDKEKFYDYNLLEYNNMTDPKYIQGVLMQKYKTRTEEMNQFNALLDEEGQGFHRSLPTIYDFSNIRGTKTIYDDMNDGKLYE